jgi:prolyl oligopeptidase
VTLVGELLYLSEFVDTYARVRIVDLGGREMGQVPLPGRGALGTLEELSPLMKTVPTGHPDEFVFVFSTFTESWGLYRHRPGDDVVETLIAPAVRVDASISDQYATSVDGTRVPYHVMRRADIHLDAPQPVLIQAYGGWNAPLQPGFPGSIAAFVKAGGVYVHAHIRGGGEFGHDWWEQGRLKNKQNCYDDLYAVAEDIVACGLTAYDRLAVTGGSNGGLMVGVAVTQRPELWRAAVPRVPFLDILGGCREPFSRAAVAQGHGDPDDPADVARLASFSPYQQIRTAVAYPAVYVDAGDTDMRCPPWHARKFAARLQEATSSQRPVFVRVWENTGHNTMGRDIATQRESAWLAFLADQLEMSADAAQGPDVRSPAAPE